MKANKTTFRRRRRFSSSGPLVLLVSAAALVPSGALAQWNSSYTLCAPQYTGVPFTYQPPAVDGTFVTKFQGNVDLDTGWTGAFRYVSSAGTVSTTPPYNVNPATTPDAAFQVIQDSSTHSIYISFQVNNDPTFDTEDAIILGFDPDNKVNGDGVTHPNMQRIIIYPVVGGVGAKDPAGKLPAGAIRYWKTWVKGTGWPNPVTTDPAFVTAVAQSAGAGPFSWDVQIKIDNSSLGLPASPTSFGVYVNMLRVNSSTSPNTDTEFMWPANTPLGLLIPGSEFVLEGNSLPDPSQWGTGSLATSCSGVNISSGDITGSHGSTISLNQPNQFSVVIHNSGSRTANQVFATFQIANYGLPAPDDWARPGEVFSNLIPNDPLPSDTSPPTVTVFGGGGTATMSTGTWTPGTNHASDGSTPLDEHDYYQATPDTCIRVILSSLATDTIFSVRSSWNNFETGNTSTFKQTATVGTRGYRLAEGAANHEFYLTVAHDYTPACEDKELLAKYPDLGYSIYRKAVHGCRITGRRVVIKEKKFDECEDVGSFGYNLRHQGRVRSMQSFTDNMTGEGLQKTKNGYHLVVAPGKKASLTTTVVSEGGHEGGGGGQGGKPGGCGEGNKKQGGVGAVGVLLIGLLTFTHSRKHRG